MEQEEKNKNQQKSFIAKMEEDVLVFWDKDDAFRNSLRARMVSVHSLLFIKTVYAIMYA